MPGSITGSFRGSAEAFQSSLATQPFLILAALLALTTAADLGLSPHALVMGVALSAASLSSPVAHPANVLIMGPGGYRYMDYVRVGVPLTRNQQ